ncbi:MAG TPA: sulfide/dihydroorotate dehydrogenase-like FAD/NAD-binding protein [candidate division Zixibacteria bacterium]|nr:sulfide/dihydroorotate dehydrogenase-like FAD/NAD-binding protein [candidate division Zixibacteria bacterium]
MYKVIDNRMVVPNIHMLRVEAPHVSREARPGQFVIVRAEDDGERIPLSISDWDARDGTIVVVYKNVGATTNRLSNVRPGESLLTVVGPLGKETEIDTYGTVLCVGGCYGIGSIYPIARALRERGNRVIVVGEARSSYLTFWDDKLRAAAHRVVWITRDGTRGLRGHVPRLSEVIGQESGPINRAIVNGCTFLMKRVSDMTRPLGIKTIVSLNPIMIDGTGMCGVCRVSVGGATRFACVDGPDFDGHEVDWTELLQRRKSYLTEEIIPQSTSRYEEHAGNA